MVLHSYIGSNSLGDAAVSISPRRPIYIAWFDYSHPPKPKLQNNESTDLAKLIAQPSTKNITLDWSTGISRNVLIRTLLSLNSLLSCFTHSTLVGRHVGL